MKVIFHKFNIRATIDDDVVVAEPIYQWQQTEHGRWVMDHARDLTYHHHQSDLNHWSYDVIIRGELCDKSAVEYHLRFGASQ